MIFKKSDRAKLDWIQAEMVRNAGEYVRRCKLNDERWEAIEQSQGKLLAALNLVETLCDAIRLEHIGLADELRNGRAASAGQIARLQLDIRENHKQTLLLIGITARQPRRQGKRKRK